MPYPLTSRPGAGVPTPLLDGMAYFFHDSDTDLASLKFYDGSIVPIGGGGGGSTPARKATMVLAAGVTPTLAGELKPVLVVPPSTGGWTVVNILFRVESAGTTDQAITLETYTGSAAFSPTSFATITLPSGDLEVSLATVLPALAAGTKVRVIVGALSDAERYGIFMNLTE